MLPVESALLLTVLMGTYVSGLASLAYLMTQNPGKVKAVDNTHGL